MAKIFSVLLVALVVVVFCGSYQSDAPLGRRFPFAKSTLKNWLQHINDWRKNVKEKVDREELADLAALDQLKDNQQNIHSNDIQSSIITAEEVHSLMKGRANNYGCTCSASHICSTTCSILSSTCGRTCTTLVVFKGHYHTGVGLITTTTTVNIYNSGCDTLSAACASSTAIARLAAAAAVAIAVGVAVPVGIGAINAAQVQNQQREVVQQGVTQFLAGGGLFDTRTPVNDLPVPVQGISNRDDGCGDISVRFRDGICYPVLRRGPCDNPLHWLTVDPTNLSGQCRPRLCGKGRVFVGRDGLCHDVDDPLECRGGRRLYYTAYGDPICDCPIGQFPFPRPQDDCVALFTQGPCLLGQVLSIGQSGALGCSPAQCQPTNQGRKNTIRQLAPAGNGFCYDIGSRGPCLQPSSSSKAQFFGFDVFSKTARCVDIRSPSTAYYTSVEEDAFLDATFNELYPEFSDYQVQIVKVAKRRGNATAKRKQDEFGLGGIFRVPSYIPDNVPEALLNPCRPGSRYGNNYKCTNPLLPDRIYDRRRSLLQAVRSAFECPIDPNRYLQATGTCARDSYGASCGPSYQYIQSIGQCRPLVQF